jgi:hypothetical protein
MRKFAVISVVMLLLALNVVTYMTTDAPELSHFPGEASVATAQSQQTIQRIMNDVWDKSGKRLMSTPWAGAQGTSQSETFIWNDVWDQANHLIRTSGGSGSGGAGPPGPAGPAGPPGPPGSGGGSSAVITAEIPCDGTTVVSATLQSIINAAPSGSHIVLPPGICMLNATITVGVSVTLEGAGINHTTLRQTNAAIPVMTVGAVNDVTLLHFTADHSGTPTAGGHGIVVSQYLNHAYLEYIAADRNYHGFVLGCIAYGWVSHLQASANNGNGFEFVYPAATCGSAQWQMHHVLAQLNKGFGFHGLNSESANGIAPFISDATSFGNDLGGYVFQGTVGHPINDLMLLNVLSSADNVYGILLDTYGGSHLIDNPWVELTGQVAGITGFPIGTPSTTSTPSATGHCVTVTANNLPGINIVGGQYWNCAWSGLSLGAANSAITGGTSIGNGRGLDVDPLKRASVAITANKVMVSSHIFNYAAGVGTLDYITVAAGVTGTVIGINNYDTGLPAEISTVSGLPAGSTDFAGTGGPGQVLKQLSVGGPVTVGPLSSGEVGLGNVDNTSDATKNSTPRVITNAQVVARVPTCTVTGSGPFIITPNADTTDVCESYAITGALQIANPTATGANPRPHQRLEFALKSATPQTVTFTGSLYDNSCGQPLPTSLTGDGSTTDHFLFALNPNTNKFCALASSRAPAKRLNTFTSAVASPTLTCVSPTTDRCQLTATGATGTITIANPTGLPNDGDMMMIALLCSAVHAVAWDTQFVGSPNIPLPTTAACPADTAKWTVFGVQYSASLAPPKWQLLGAN